MLPLRSRTLLLALWWAAPAAAASDDACLSIVEQAWPIALLELDSPSPLSALGECYLRLGRLEEAQALLEAALQRGSTLAADHASLGVVAMRRGHFAAAADHFAAALRSAPPEQQPGSAHNLGQALLRLGRPTEAARQFEHIVQLDPRNPTALRDLAASYNQAGAYDQTLDLLEPALEPTAGVLLERSRALFFLGRYEQSAAAADAAEKLDPERAAAPRAAARAWLELQRFEPAGAALERALRLDPSDPDTLQLRVELCSKQGRAADALAAARAWSQAHPASSEAWLELGGLLVQAGERSGAIAAFEAALRLQPDLSSAHYQLAQLYRQTGDPASARGALQAFRDSSPPTGPGAEAYELGARLLGQQRPLDALPLLEQAFAAQPAEPRAVLRRAQALDSLGRESEALEAYDAAQQLGAPALELLAYRGELLRRLGDYERSEQDLACAFELRGQTLLGARVARALGELRRRRGDFKAARIAYAAALEVDSGDRAARQGLELCEAALSDATGLAQLELGAFAERLASLDQAAESGRADPWAYRRLAQAAASAGARGTSLAALERHALLRPLDPDAARAAAAALALEGRFDQASEVLLRCRLARADPTVLEAERAALAAAADLAERMRKRTGSPAASSLATLRAAPAPLPAVAAYLAAGLALQAGDSGDALRQLREATELEPDFFLAWLQRGRLERGAGGLEAARLAYARAAALDRNSALAALNLGAALAQLGDLAAGEIELERACRLDPNLAEAFRNLAAVRLRGGHPQQARQPLEQAERLGADVSQLRAELERALGVER